MRKALRILVTILLAYILQTTVLPRITILEIKPDVMLATLVILTQDGDRFVGFCCGSVVGLLMDAMVAQLPFLYLITYPLIGYAAARIFPLLLEKLQLPRKIGRFLSARRFAQFISMLTAAALALVYEFALMIYRYLNGVDITLASIGRMFRFTLYTAVATFFVQFLVRFCMTATVRFQRGEGPEK